MSNSSSSSFVIYGFTFNMDDVFGEFNEDGPEDLIEGIISQFSDKSHHMDMFEMYNETTYVGVTPTTIRIDNENDFLIEISPDKMLALPNKYGPILDKMREKINEHLTKPIPEDAEPILYIGKLS